MYIILFQEVLKAIQATKHKLKECREKIEAPKELIAAYNSWNTLLHKTESLSKTFFSFF
jgi:hypothetical protein